MSKFKETDIIQVESQQDPGTFNIGIIESVDTHIVQGFIPDVSYRVRWVQTGLYDTYRAAEVDHLWTHSSINNSIQQAATALFHQHKSLMGSPWLDTSHNLPEPEEKKVCNHNWKVYDSGFSYYEYCEHCDIKKAQ